LGLFARVETLPLLPVFRFLLGYYSKIIVRGKFGKLNSTHAGNHILHRPLAPQNIEKLQARGTDMGTVCYRIRGLPAAEVYEKLGIDKVGMVGRMAQKNLLKIERFVDLVTFEPSLVKILFKRMRSIPRPRHRFLK
jgi:hypothetical protein